MLCDLAVLGVRDVFRPAYRVATRNPTGLCGVRSADGAYLQEVKTTNGHVFWAFGKGWLTADRLVPGDSLLQLDGRLGTLEATGSGGLLIHSDVVNSGIIWANSGNITVDGNGTGSGSALISGNGSIEFAGLVAEDIKFAEAATGTVKLDASAS